MVNISLYREIQSFEYKGLEIKEATNMGNGWFVHFYDHENTKKWVKFLQAAKNIIIRHLNRK